MMLSRRSIASQVHEFIYYIYITLKAIYVAVGQLHRAHEDIEDHLNSTSKNGLAPVAPCLTRITQAFTYRSDVCFAYKLILHRMDLRKKEPITHTCAL